MVVLIRLNYYLKLDTKAKGMKLKENGKICSQENYGRHLKAVVSLVNEFKVYTVPTGMRA